MSSSVVRVKTFGFCFPLFCHYLRKSQLVCAYVCWISTSRTAASYSCTHSGIFSSILAHFDTSPLVSWEKGQREYLPASWCSHFLSNSLLLLLPPYLCFIQKWKRRIEKVVCLPCKEFTPSTSEKKWGILLVHGKEGETRIIPRPQIFPPPKAEVEKMLGFLNFVKSFEIVRWKIRW